MANIPDTEYITVKRNKNGAVGVFVGGKPATTYRGVRICDINYVKNAFAGIQEQNPNITELHVLSSKTCGEYSEVGNPSFEHGRYAWVRVVLSDGTVGGWVFGDLYMSAPNCAYYCAGFCAGHVRASATFQLAVLSAAFGKQNVETNSAVKSQNKEIPEFRGVIGLLRRVTRTPGCKR